MGPNKFIRKSIFDFRLGILSVVLVNFRFCSVFRRLNGLINTFVPKTTESKTSPNPDTQSLRVISKAILGGNPAWLNTFSK